MYEGSVQASLEHLPLVLQDRDIQYIIPYQPNNKLHLFLIYKGGTVVLIDC